MAKISMNMLDADVRDSITGMVKKHMIVLYGHVPVDKKVILQGIDRSIINMAENEIKLYYDGLYDEGEVSVDISKEEYAALL